MDCDEYAHHCCDLTQQALHEMDSREVEAVLQAIAQDVREMHETETLPHGKITSSVSLPEDEIQ